MRNAILFSLILLSATLQAGCPQPGIPNIAARPQCREHNYDLFGDALYWHVTESVDWSYSINVMGSVETVSYKTVTFDWDPGFRVGIGYNMKHDQWDTQLYFTRLQAHPTHHATGGSNGLTSVFFGSKIAITGAYQTGKIGWKLDYNLFDWDLGRRFWVSDALILRPLIGVKAGWINQATHTFWRNADFLDDGLLFTSTETLRHNFTGGGPKGGVNGTWILARTCNFFFSLFGDFSAAYMWGHWTIRDKFNDSLSVTVITKVGDRHFGSLALQSLTGIGFDFNFNRDRSHFALKIGYEIQDWLDQYQGFDNATGAHNNDLILQGLTADFRLDF